MTWLEVAGWLFCLFGFTRDIRRTVRPAIEYVPSQPPPPVEVILKFEVDSGPGRTTAFVTIWEWQGHTLRDDLAVAHAVTNLALQLTERAAKRAEAESLP